ncbi:hypothetical protein ACFFQF_10205 [Haladaptatus pallidirubidus]|uniref:hypothetical protein n=1 Tax=Haladaptatus pallidirubidus TaxID=1008152 RepID=UPI0035E7B68D
MAEPLVPFSLDRCHPVAGGRACAHARPTQIRPPVFLGNSSLDTLWIANQSFEGRVRCTRPLLSLMDAGERETSDCKERVTSEGDS